MCRNAGFATGVILLGVLTATARAANVPIALTFNWNGIIQISPTDERDDPENLNGFRAISDRAIRVDGGVGSFGTAAIVGATGLTYVTESHPTVLDMIFLGNRNTLHAFNTITTDDYGPQPSWLPAFDVPGPVITNISPPVLLDGTSQIGVLYHMTNSGALTGQTVSQTRTFHMVLGFIDAAPVDLTVSGTDWFFNPNSTNWYTANAIPSPVAPNGGCVARGRLGNFNGQDHGDRGLNSAGILHITESVFSVAQINANGLGDLNGKQLSSVRFQNASTTASGFGVYSVTVGGGAIAPANDNCSNCVAIGEGLFTGSSGGSSGTDVTNQCGAGDSNDVWYCYTSSLAGTARASLCNSGFDTTVAVFDACNGNEIACNDDGACPPQSTVDFSVNQGGIYRIRISGANGARGNFSLLVTNPPNILHGPVINPANGHAYYLLTTSTWADAENDAIALGGHLVTINDADENAWVLANVLGFDTVPRRGWLGLQRTPAGSATFAWLTGDPLDYTNWTPGEPNSTLENFGEMLSTGTWNDSNGTLVFVDYGMVEEPGPSNPVGDMNCDSSVNTGDIGPFILALIDPTAYANTFPACNINNADANGDTTIDGRDISAFTHLIAP